MSLGFGINAKLIHPNMSLHSNIKCTEWQTESDLAAAPTTVLENPEPAVATLIKIPGTDPRPAAATMIIQTPVPLAVGLTPMKMTDNDTNLVRILVVTEAREASR
jgi:hypothetical protein